jgi:hypothetical protein
MKTLFFTLIICAGLLRGVCYADPPVLASEQSHTESSDAAAVKNPDEAKRAVAIEGGKYQMERKPLDREQNGYHASDKKGPSANVTNLHQPAKPAKVASRGLLTTGDSHRQPAKSTALIPLGGPFLNHTRNHDPSLAAIGGVANPIRSTAAINGTGMNHKP